MRTMFRVMAILGWACLLYPATGNSEDTSSSVSANIQHTNKWNLFAKRLYMLHQQLIAEHKFFTKESKGGYADNKDFYREVKYYDKKSQRLLSRVLWELENPGQLHEIEVFIYDPNGKLKRDYLAAFLPVYRNAPIQTLIDFHYQNDELKSFRQFDASGIKTYESCEGKFLNEPVNIALTDDDFAESSEETMQLLKSQEYQACFGHTTATLGHYVDPLYGISLPVDLQQQTEKHPLGTPDSMEQKIKQLSNAINKQKSSAKLYVERGMAYHTLLMFDKAVADFNHALELDDSLDGAYFGRGLAYGRMHMLKEGIADLTIFLKRNPNSSVAYTKRGVRRIWAGQYQLAEQDLRKAITLDPKNAEAHDDLGVMDARKGDYEKALLHFKDVVSLDPSYFKGFHNLAMTQYILGDYHASLENINKALELTPNNRNELLLKAEVLSKMGKDEAAKAIMNKAESLPEGGWQERFSLQ